MTSGENQTKPTTVSEFQTAEAKARRVSQEGSVPLPPPLMTASSCDSRKSPQYVSGGEDEDGAVLLRGESPMRCVSEFDDGASSTSGGEQAAQFDILSKTDFSLSAPFQASTPAASTPVLPNPLLHPKLRSNHVVALQLEGQLHAMRMILMRLMVHASNKKGLFNCPVDVAALGLVDYHRVIRKPMDLGTVKARLYSIAYPSREEVAADIYLVFENAMAYNPPRNSVHIAARTLRDYFEDLYVAVGGEKKALPGHIVTESTDMAVGASLAATLSRRVSFAVAPASSGDGPVDPTCGLAVSGIAPTASSEAELVVAVAPNTGVAEGATIPAADATSSLPLAASTVLSAQQSASVAPTAALCSTVNSQNSSNGLTQVGAALSGSPQGTRARANSFSSPAPLEVAKPTRRRRLSFAGKNRTVGHSCTSCLGRNCAYCDQGCLPLEPTLLVCNGSSCAGSKIRKGATFFIAEDGTRHYCQRCFTNLPPVLPLTGAEQGVRYKRDLLKRKYDEELVENWVTCKKCNAGVHHICAMFNSYADSRGNYLCPGCEDPPQTVRMDTDNDSATSKCNDIYSFVTGSEKPVPLSDVAGSSFCLGKDVLSADTLPETDVSAFIEMKVKERLKESCGVPNAEKTVLVRILSDCNGSFQVPDVVRKHFRMPTTGSDLDDVVAPPARVGYRSKAITLFQKVDGLDVCIFCMYVQEYDGNDDYYDDSGSLKSGDASRNSKKRVYIAYLDSVEHFRPRRSRTDLYHELLVSYLASARVRGFESAHIWACPPSRGNSFVFWNHPASQRTPTKERLISWYHGALSRAIDCGVVTDVKSLYESDFQGQLEQAGRNSTGEEILHSSGKLLCPPLLEGDFWIEEAVRIHASSFSRHQKFKTDGKTPSNKSSEQPVGTSWDPCPARQIASLLADRLMVHPSSAPFRLPVNAAALKLKDYHKIVSTPMDLGTVYSRCIHGEFHTLNELVADVALVFQNAKIYNPPDNYVHKMAIEMEALFFDELSNVTSRWRSDCNRKEPTSWQSCAGMNMSLDTRLNIQASVADTIDEDGLSSDGRCATEMKTDTEGIDESQQSKVPEAPVPCEKLLNGGPDAVSQRMAGKDKWMIEKKGALPQKRPIVSKKSGCKRRRGSVAAVNCEEDSNSKRRRQTWLGEEVAASVRSMRTSFFACSLSPTESMSERQQEKAVAYSQYASCHKKDADCSVISSPITDARHALLEFSQYRNLEFATLRHAKFSTAVLLYHLHNYDAPGMVPTCTSCNQETVDCRWHKVAKIEEVRRGPVNRKRPGRPTLDDDKSKYQAEELCAACYAKHPKKDQFIPLHVSLSSTN